MVKTSYDKKLFRIVVDSTAGDKVKIQFPVGAIKKILKATGKLPISEKELEGIDLTGMMVAMAGLIIRWIPDRVIGEMRVNIPQPYNALITKQNMTMLLSVRHLPHHRFRFQIWSGWAFEVG